MLSRFHTIPERDGQTDKRTDKMLSRYRASLCWHAIKYHVANGCMQCASLTLQKTYRKHEVRSFFHWFHSHNISNKYDKFDHVVVVCVHGRLQPSTPSGNVRMVRPTAISNWRYEATRDGTRWVLLHWPTSCPLLLLRRRGSTGRPRIISTAATRRLIPQLSTCRTTTRSSFIRGASAWRTVLDAYGRWNSTTGRQPPRPEHYFAVISAWNKILKNPDASN